jgi:hypothetical protein
MFLTHRRFERGALAAGGVILIGALGVALTDRPSPGAPTPVAGPPSAPPAAVALAPGARPGSAPPRQPRLARRSAVPRPAAEPQPSRVRSVAAGRRLDVPVGGNSIAPDEAQGSRQPRPDPSPGSAASVGVGIRLLGIGLSAQATLR